MRYSESSPNFGAAEKFLLSLDEGALGPLFRLLIGFATFPAMRLMLGRDGSDWMLIPFLLIVLVLLRLVPAIVRKLVPFSPELREVWSVRRRTAKLYDSYQWRKLVWIGAGLALYGAISGQYSPVQIALSIFCLVTGAVATVRWRAVSADSKFPKPMARMIKSAAAPIGNAASVSAVTKPPA